MAAVNVVKQNELVDQFGPGPPNSREDSTTIRPHHSQAMKSRYAALISVLTKEKLHVVYIRCPLRNISDHSGSQPIFCDGALFWLAGA
jgi:hypothetical protein